jgi:hypothetical protein
VRNEEVLHRIKEDRNILHTIKRRKAKWIGHVLRKNCLLKHVTVGKMKITGRRGSRRNQLLFGHQKNEGRLEIGRGSIRSNSVKNLP